MGRAIWYAPAVVILTVACADRPLAVHTPEIRLVTQQANESGQCNPETAIEGCEVGPWPGSGYPAPVGLNVGYSWASCLAPAVDVDGDGLDDNCEIALAQAFSPGMMVYPGECAWDGGLDRIGGEYYYGVKRMQTSDNRIRIVYLPAYYRDCGFGSHTGDSEFIAVDVAYLPGSNFQDTWQFLGAYLSAHCGADVLSQPSDPDCRFWDHAYWGLADYVNGIQRGAPMVWVARGKHANYYSRAKCESGWAGVVNVDRCPGYGYAMRRFPIVYRWQNIDFPESGAYRMVKPRWGSTLPNPNAEETFAETRCDQVTCYKFNGWLIPTSSGDGSTPYWRILRFWLGWWPTTYAPPQNECEYDPHTAIFQPC